MSNISFTLLKLLNIIVTIIAINKTQIANLIFSLKSHQIVSIYFLNCCKVL